MTDPYTWWDYTVALFALAPFLIAGAGIVVAVLIVLRVVGAIRL